MAEEKVPRDPRADYGLAQFRGLADFDRQAQDALDYLRQKDLDRVALQRSEAENAVLANFIEAGKTPEGGFDPFSEKAIRHTARLTTTRFAPIVDALGKAEEIKQVRTQTRRPFDVNGATYQLGKGGDYQIIGEAPLTENMAYNWLMSGDPAKVKKANEFLGYKEQHDGSREDYTIPKARAEYATALEVLETSKGTGIEEVYNKAIQSGLASENELASIDPSLILMKFLENKPENMAMAKQISDYARAKRNVVFQRNFIKETGGKTEDIEERFKPKTMSKSTGEKFDSTKVDFSKVEKFLAKHESAGGKFKKSFEANKDGSYDWGRYQINDRNLVGESYGDKFVEQREKIFADAGVGSTLAERQKAMLDDKVSYKLAELIYKTAGIDAWATAKDVIADYGGVSNVTVGAQDATGVAKKTGKLQMIGKDKDGREIWGYPDAK